MHNFTYWIENFVDLSVLSYVNIFGFFFWPFLFTVIIAYVYFEMESFVAATIVVLIIMSVFGNALMGVDAWVTLMHLFVALVTTALILIFISKRRGG